MLPIDVQAEMILSFQEEKRQRFLEMQARQQATAGLRPSLRTRLLRAGGNTLIAAGRSLQRAAGVTPGMEFDGRRLGWEK